MRVLAECPDLSSLVYCQVPSVLTFYHSDDPIPELHRLRTATIEDIHLVAQSRKQFADLTVKAPRVLPKAENASLAPISRYSDCVPRTIECARVSTCALNPQRLICAYDASDPDDDHFD